MAEVDFSNARIEPWCADNSLNPTVSANVSLAGMSGLYNSSLQAVSSDLSRSQLINQQKQLMYLYQGTFNTGQSGTEFYVLSYTNSKYIGWKVSNISFDSGDTYVFQINATLTCN